jgi:hypothetical protein
VFKALVVLSCPRWSCPSCPAGRIGPSYTPTLSSASAPSIGAFLDNGALGKKYASASEHLFAVEQSLLKHLKPPQAYQILISADGSWGVALEHRENNEQRAREFIWMDLQRASTSKEKHEKEKASAEAGWKDCDIVVELTEEGARARVSAAQSDQRSSEASRVDQPARVQHLRWTGDARSR